MEQGWQGLVELGLIKDRSLTGLKRSELGGGSVSKALRDGVLTGAGLVGALRRVQKLAQRGKPLLEVVSDNLAQIRAGMEDVRELVMQLRTMYQQVERQIQTTI